MAQGTGPEARLRLPPLRALRAFEAAARWSSFTRAADELNVTQAAVSHQVRLLEQHLGEHLFIRHRNGLTMTDRGQDYFVTVHQALRQVSEATERIVCGVGPARLVISALPNFALRWLLPRLSGFRQRHPDIEVVVSTSPRSLDFQRNEMDVAIRFCDAGDAHHYEYLFTPVMLPVCNEALLTNGRPLRHPDDLRQHALIHIVAEDHEWRRWLAAAGLSEPAAQNSLQVDSFALAVQAAIAGHGVALAPLPMVFGDLESGRLQAPFTTTIQSHRAWYLVYPEIAHATRGVAAFRRWMLAEARETCAKMDEWTRNSAAAVPSQTALASANPSRGSH